MMTIAQFVGIIASIMLGQFLYGFVRGLLGRRDRIRGRCDVCNTPITGRGTYLRLSMSGRPDTVIRRCSAHPVTADQLREIAEQYRDHP